MLLVLEYVPHVRSPYRKRFPIPGTMGGQNSVYEQVWGSQVSRIENYNKGAAAYINGRKVFEAGPNLRIITDLTGRLLKVMGYTQDTDVKKACRNLKLPVQP